jgi:glutathione S-transferase
MTTPILYSFRRCPYAMRARLAISVAGIPCDLREIVLRDKAPAFLATSPSGTVPCLQTGTAVIDESLDIGRHGDPAFRAPIRWHRQKLVRRPALAAPAQMGVSETLCMEFSPCGFHGSSVEPFGI